MLLWNTFQHKEELLPVWAQKVMIFKNLNTLWAFYSSCLGSNMTPFHFCWLFNLAHQQKLICNFPNRKASLFVFASNIPGACMICLVRPDLSVKSQTFTGIKICPSCSSSTMHCSFYSSTMHCSQPWDFFLILDQSFSAITTL